MGLIHFPLGRKDFGFSPLELGDVRVHRDGATIIGLPLVDLNPVAVAAPLDMWFARIAMFCQPFRDPLVDTALGILDQSAFGRGPDDRLVGRTASWRGESAPEKLAIVAIAYDEPIVRVIQ